MKTIQQFANEHQACPEGVGWALDNCKDLQEFWEKADPEWLLWVATRKGVLTDKELRSFAIACVRHHLDQRKKDQLLEHALNLAGGHSEGSVSDDDLRAVGTLVSEGMAEADDWSHRYACSDPGKLSYQFVVDCANLNVRKAVMLTHDAAPPEFQAKWLRENTKPNFN